jgi:hypothetical protein
LSKKIESRRDLHFENHMDQRCYNLHAWNEVVALLPKDGGQPHGMRDIVLQIREE